MKRVLHPFYTGQIPQLRRKNTRKLIELRGAKHSKFIQGLKQTKPKTSHEKTEATGQSGVYKYTRVLMFPNSFGIGPVNRFPSIELQKKRTQMRLRIHNKSNASRFLLKKTAKIKRKLKISIHVDQFHGTPFCRD